MVSVTSVAQIARGEFLGESHYPGLDRSLYRDHLSRSRRLLAG